MRTLSLMDSKALIENTDISEIINHMFDDSWWIMVLIESLYLLQGILISFFVNFYRNYYAKLGLWISMMITAAVLIAFEVAQFLQLGRKWYF